MSDNISSSKSHLTLYIDNELKALAKASNINLSNEFENFLRFRLKQDIKQESIIDTELEIAKHKQAIDKLLTQKELQQTQEMKEKEEIMVIDHIIDNEIQFTSKEELPSKRANGLQFLFKQKFNKYLAQEEAIKLLEDRIKERGL